MGKITSKSKEEIIEKIKDSFCIREVLTKLGVNSNGSGAYNTIRRFCTDNDIELKFNTKNLTIPKKLYKLEEILVENSKYQNRKKLKERLIKEGLLINKCYECGLIDWNGKPISLHLEHINGVNDDHRKENLKLLCPNCHSQTNTFSGRNVRIRNSKK